MHTTFPEVACCSEGTFLLCVVYGSLYGRVFAGVFVYTCVCMDTCVCVINICSLRGESYTKSYCFSKGYSSPCAVCVGRCFFPRVCALVCVCVCMYSTYGRVCMFVIVICALRGERFTLSWCNVSHKHCFVDVLDKNSTRTRGVR